MKQKQKYALISVYDKKGIVPLAKAFQKANVSIISSSGTAAFLTQNKIQVIPIEEITKSPESFDGRMKTISFQVASGILFDRSEKKHVEDAKKLTIPSIDFIICNVYPFWEKPSIELIDVGGPTMIRAAAKNYESVTVVVDPNDYKKVINQLKQKNATTKELRYQLAAKAFSSIADYDELISNYFNAESLQRKTVSFYNGKQLRYGDNPHQKGFFYQEQNVDVLALQFFKVLQGKDPSFSNYLDLSAGIDAMCLLGQHKPFCVILKHNNPCGAANAETIEESFRKAWYEGDSLAAFGGIVLLNRQVTKTVAEKLISDGKFMEIVAAPSFTLGALTLLAKKSKLQLWQNEALQNPMLLDYEDIKKVRGGYLIQDANTSKLTEKDLKIVTKKKLSAKQISDVLFAWSITQVSKSNSVVVAKDNTLLSTGVGQQDRKRCCELCVSKATGSLKKASAASDGFFPFTDGPQVLVNAGITAIIQPGGSIRDGEVIDYCDKNNIAMVFTGVRAFKH